MKVMIVVTHLLGTGHLSRALTLARAFQSAEDQVIVVSGGMPAPQLPHDGVMLIQLPPVRSDGVNFSTLLDAAGEPVTAQMLSERRAQLLNLIDIESPDVLITELFPFGRRSLVTEFTALLTAARGLATPPLIFASIRDILAPPLKPKKAEFADQTIANFYDAVLVHSSPEITPLDLSWPVSAALRPMLRYTGFVAPPMALPHPNGLGRDEIIISAGGGDVGANLFDCAVAAAKLNPPRRWRLLIGGRQAAARIQHINASASENLFAEAARPDFRQMLHHAYVSVSMCGYNTAMDLLQSGCPAVFLPFDAGQEVEQSIRARALANRAGITVLEAASLTPKSLLQAIEAVTSQPRRQPLMSGLDGAAETVRIVHNLFGSRR